MAVDYRLSHFTAHRSGGRVSACIIRRISQVRRAAHAMITIEHILAQAAAIADDYARAVADIPYEHKGVLFSEILFLCAALGPERPERVVESGRARGQSTHLLATCLPECEIVSVERNPDSPDVPVAAARLAPFGNVQLLFGDAMRMLPELVREGDAVLIDGPKGYRALRLAFKVLASCRPRAVFIHDCGLGTEERKFLDRYVPETVYSDAPAFVERYAFLDAACRALNPDVAREDREPGRSYGPTVACVPYNPAQRYTSLLRRATLRGMLDRLGARLRRRLRSAER